MKLDSLLSSAIVNVLIIRFNLLIYSYLLWSYKSKAATPRMQSIKLMYYLDATGNSASVFTHSHTVAYDRSIKDPQAHPNSRMKGLVPMELCPLVPPQQSSYVFP